MLIGTDKNTCSRTSWIRAPWALLFFSGSFSKQVFIEGLGDKLPYIVQQAAFRLTLYGENNGALAVIAVSLAVTVAVSLIGAAIFRVKKSV